MNEELLVELFDGSLNIFLTHETENILSNVAERNLCGRLAIYITPKLDEFGIKGYFADPEYNRKQGGRVKTILDGEETIIPIQCDLIVHSRGNVVKHDNLIAIEMKKSTRPEAEKVADRKRLRTMTKDSYDGVWSWEAEVHPEHVCGYLLGVYVIVNIAERSCQIEYYAHGNLAYERVQRF
ncbi:hypothetical protein [Flavobacterium sp. CAU 1735]|uniref:hypothetical protein n=1 Tax=Flavobacterium sp. CAU 1735 TaxID=3140361 RepID=UPI003260BD66